MRRKRRDPSTGEWFTLHNRTSQSGMDVGETRLWGTESAMIPAEEAAADVNHVATAEDWMSQAC